MDLDGSVLDKVWNNIMAIMDEDNAVTEEQHSAAEPATNGNLTWFAPLDAVLLKYKESSSSAKRRAGKLPEKGHGAVGLSANKASTQPASAEAQFTALGILSPFVDLREASSQPGRNVFPSIYDAFGYFILNPNNKDFGEAAFHSVRNEKVRYKIELPLNYFMEPFVEADGTDALVNRVTDPIVNKVNRISKVNKIGRVNKVNSVENNVFNVDNNCNHSRNYGGYSHFAAHIDSVVHCGKDLSVNFGANPYAIQSRIDPSFDRTSNDPFVDHSREKAPGAQGIKLPADQCSSVSSTDLDDSIFIPGIVAAELATASYFRQIENQRQETPKAFRGGVFGNDSKLVQNSAHQKNGEASTTRELELATPKDNRCQAVWRLPSWLTPKSVGPSATSAPFTPTTTRTTPERNPQTEKIAREIDRNRQRIYQQFGRHPNSIFRPSRMVRHSNADRGGEFPPMISQGDQRATNHDDTVPRYRAGSDSHLLANTLVPDWENCAIWITGIPAEATYTDVLNVVRGGKVFVCLMNRPTGDFTTSAAKLVFFRRESAVAFLDRENYGGVYILGQRIKSQWNRIRYPAHHLTHQSRVVMISGPADWMSFDYFETFFSSLFQYDLESRYEVPLNEPGRRMHVWRFASLRAQAESAKMSIERELGSPFRVDYGPDPCALPWF